MSSTHKWCIVTSRADPASTNIRTALLNEGVFEDRELSVWHDIGLVDTETEPVLCDEVIRLFHAETYIFASRHESLSSGPCLCVHCPGNWGPAMHGGKDRSLCTAPALAMRQAFLLLKEHSHSIDYDAMLEATHHGPNMDKPCFFIEIGSSEKEWKDPAAGRIIARALLKLCTQSLPKAAVALGIGGPHHAPKFSRMAESTAFGHICPKRSLEFFDEHMLCQAVERNADKVEKAVLDWKGLGQHKQRIIACLEKHGLPFERA